MQVRAGCSTNCRKRQDQADRPECVGEVGWEDAEKPAFWAIMVCMGWGAGREESRGVHG